jgi:DNA polymerase-3 subunit gamma/tau
MAYQSLYRRYRPRRFSDVRGQEQVVKALRNAVRDDRVGHAYLFSGPRGTGKTSTARILAKALNCEHLIDGEPCGTCDSCLSIDAGTSYDVQELDAASNNGVENVRDLVGRANLGSPGRTKVYILDEVHMLTPAASAALLKTLEEPPDHVVFVLATTDPHKVLATIRSRTQHYEFHLLTADELAEHVAWVIHDAGLELGPDVIDPVVRAGAGSARDTLSALDRVAAAGGVVDDAASANDLVDAIAAADAGRALVAVAEAMGSGRDARVLGEEVLARLRDVFLLRMGAGTDHLPAGDLERVQVWADQLGDRATTRALEGIGDALLEMRQAPDPRIPLEVAVVKLTRTEGELSLDALVARVAHLEARVAALSAGDPVVAAGADATPEPAPTPEPAAAPAAPASAPPPAPPAAPAPVVRSAAEAPAAPGGARSGGRPADAARAELAARRAEQRTATGSRGSTPRSAGPTASPPPPPLPPPAGVDAPAPAERAPAPPAVPAPPPAPEAPAPAAPAASAPAASAAASVAVAAGPAGLTVERVTELWHDIPGLSGLTKGMFAAGTVVSVANGEVVVSVPNEVHRQKCEQKKADVEAALAAALGAAVRLSLVADVAPAPGRGSVSPEPVEPVDEFEELAGADVHDLPDAPDASVGGVDALTEAFPGSTFVDGP